ncbi:7-cyano-7-deazaguanine synthase [Sulfuracidifex tepidarius]|uniref:7-cyano-7-deazaguanine synthase n=1 Tax=Sulfuracidifex tepidarius TaxID=1294262 RepID=A0A510DTY8_9CREN|nr:7-cyano-7-deazaguanine synthase [Sulfuracidifex tepidarius]BBG23614.1 7-cyano-7-deazaguanine synthase [Sulfuracidifex tepidarius]
MEDAIIQLTGGLDSTVLAHHLKDKYRIHGVFINYGYAPQVKEFELVKELAQSLAIELKVVDFSSYIKSFDLLPISSSNYMLKHQFLIEILASLSAYPDLNKVFVGWLKGEWNKKKEMLDQVQATLDFKVIAPFSDLTKGEVIRLGQRLGVDFTKTWSCIVSGKVHCGFCMPCRSRKRAFKESSLDDPTHYYYNESPDEIDEFISKSNVEETYGRFIKPFLEYTKEYSKEFVDNYINLMRKGNG